MREKEDRVLQACTKKQLGESLKSYARNGQVLRRTFDRIAVNTGGSSAKWAVLQEKNLKQSASVSFSWFLPMDWETKYSALRSST